MIEYNKFKYILNKKIFENSKPDLLYKIANSPERYLGIFRPTTVKNKLIQNISQSHEIRFGDAFEAIIDELLILHGFQVLEKKISIENEDCYSCDQLFEDNKTNTVFLVEQKIRDDHDSTKKKGQLHNFERKIDIISNKYKKRKLIAFFYFIDPSFKKNKNYYSAEIERIRSEYGIEIYLHYGSEFFLEIFRDGDVIWTQIELYLQQWKNEIPDFPELNYDKNSENSFSEIVKSLEEKDYSKLTAVNLNKLLNNNEIIQTIFPIIFPEKKVLNQLLDYFSKKYMETSLKINKTISDKILKAKDMY